MTGAFADHFSGVAEGYASYRPQYPAPLFSYLAGFTTGRELAWDCAAGSGQATMSLLPYFDRIVATDASEAQLAAAPAHPKVTYRVALAENSGLPDKSVNLITVAQAAHWLDLERFYQEVYRVLAPGGILAMWCYGLHRIGDPEIDHAIGFFYKNVVGPYWPPQRALIESGYRTIRFPFYEKSPPAFEMVARWTLPQLLGYLRTWSAVERYRAAKGIDPVASLEQELLPWWGDERDQKKVTWPISLRVGSPRT
jgi:SAM-dependent methyltransferase